MAIPTPFVPALMTVPPVVTIVALPDKLSTKMPSPPGPPGTPGARRRDCAPRKKSAHIADDVPTAGDKTKI